MIDLSAFDRYFAENGYKPGEAPQAFAAYLASLTGKPVNGFATDLSAAVYAGAPADPDSKAAA